MSRTRKWLIAAGGALALVMAVDFSVSLAVRSRRVTRALTSRLQAAFGRPVQVGRFDFSLWDGPRIEADNVTVGEDPRFGREYFLRAQQVSATLRWQSLIRGRIAFGTFSLSQPSLNVVTVGGRWNLADWLPTSGPGHVGTAGAHSITPQLYRIDIDGGRIDFKRGNVKLPFALVDVSGRVDESSPGRWSISIDAEPFRVAVNLQDAGTFHLAGHVGGTSARLRPASLNLRWQDASLSDVLRLATGSDYGIRGRQDIDLRAGSTGADWHFEIQGHSIGVHRWDLVSQPGNPGLNLRLAGSWSPGEGKLQITGGRIEGPESLIAVTGQAVWPVIPAAGLRAVPQDRDIRLQFTSDGIATQDLLAWYRSFHSHISSSFQAGGWLQGSLDLEGWPPHVVRANLSGDGLSIEGAPLSSPVRFSLANLSIDRGKISLSIPSMDFGAAIGRFRLRGAAREGRDWTYHLVAAGATPHINSLVRALQLLGARPLGYWNQFRGAGNIDLQWSGRLIPFERHVRASIDFHNAVWSEPSLPARVELTAARASVVGDAFRISVKRAGALGASWAGWLLRPRPGGLWRFDLSADHLDARALAARLNPQPQRPGLLERIFGFGRVSGPRASWLASLDASGRLQVRELQVEPLALGHVEGDLAIHDGAMALTLARARFSGGEAHGFFRLSVARRVPNWRLAAKVENVSLSRLSRAINGAPVRFAGIADGSFDLTARGVTLAHLRQSLSGNARLSLRQARDSHIDWLATLKAGHIVLGHSAFRQATAQMQIANGKLSFRNLLLSGTEGRLEATGGIDFLHGASLAVEARYLPAAGSLHRHALESARTFHVTGTAAIPSIQPGPVALPSASGTGSPPHRSPLP